jgi:hypothetical protein
MPRRGGGGGRHHAGHARDHLGGIFPVSGTTDGGCREKQTSERWRGGEGATALIVAAYPDGSRGGGGELFDEGLRCLARLWRGEGGAEVVASWGGGWRVRSLVVLGWNSALSPPEGGAETHGGGRRRRS